MTLAQVGQLVLAIFVAIGGAAGIVALLKLRPEKRRIQAEAHKIGVDAEVALSTAALGLLEPMQRRIKLLEDRLAEADESACRLNRELTKAQGRVVELEHQVHELSAEVAALRKGSQPPDGG